MKSAVRRHTLALLGVCLVAPALAQTAGPLNGQVVKIAHIDPFSGPFANIGQNLLKSFQFVADRIKGPGNPAGVTFQIDGIDNKGSPQDSLTALKSAIDQGYRYITQGNGSGAALAISDAVAKYNERNPGKEILYLNYGAVDPALTNEKCNYWHFRLDADTTMKMEGLTAFMKDQPSIKKVYLLNQNYSHGQQVSKYFKEDIALKRPDIQIVGDDLVPIGQVKDFSPYAAKIKQSGADSIVSGNWGADLTLFVRGLNEAGLKIPMYTYYASLTATPTALAQGGATDVYMIAYAHSNHTGEMGKLMADFKKKFNEDYYAQATYNGLVQLSAAMAKAGSSDPAKVAAAWEGLSTKSFAGEVTMRKSDHQLQQTLFIDKFEKVSAKYPYNVENTGYTFAPIKQLDPYVSSTPTSCQMKRPS